MSGSPATDDLPWDELWRPSRWLTPPATPVTAGRLHVAAIVTLAGYANVVTNRALERVWHVPFDLGVAGVAVAIARHAGATWTCLGLRRDRLGRGFRVGAIVMAVVAAALLVAVALPQTRHLFEDERVIGVPAGTVLFRALVRIPFATALGEEVLFRGVLFGLFVRHTRPLWAAVASSLLFGLWHVLPTIDTIVLNPAGTLVSGPDAELLAVAAAVLGTFVVGLGFVWLRLRANSLLAPTLAHFATNSFALLAAFFVVHALR